VDPPRGRTTTDHPEGSLTRSPPDTGQLRGRPAPRGTLPVHQHVKPSRGLLEVTTSVTTTTHVTTTTTVTTTMNPKPVVADSRIPRVRNPVTTVAAPPAARDEGARPGPDSHLGLGTRPGTTGTRRNARRDGSVTTTTEGTPARRDSLRPGGPRSVMLRAFAPRRGGLDRQLPEGRRTGVPESVRRPGKGGLPRRPLRGLAARRQSKEARILRGNLPPNTLRT
jgi:hypothetical protein